MPPVMTITFLVVNAASAIAIAIGVRRGRPTRRSAWLALAAAMGLYVIADLFAMAAWGVGDPSIGLVGQGLYVLGYPLFFYAAVRFATGARHLDPVVFIDAAIIALGVALLVWEILVEPIVSAGLTGDALLLAVGYPVAASLLVTMVLPLVLVRQTRSASAVLVLLGFLAIGLADTRFALGAIRGLVEADSLSNVGWLAGYAFLGLAGLLPSAAALGASAAPGTARRDHFRFLALSLALVIPPVLTLREVAAGHAGEIGSFAVAAIVLAGLVILRLQRTVAAYQATDDRFRRFMSFGGFFASIKDGAGRYLYMNETAERWSHDHGTDWFGRTDLELVSPEVAERRRRADDIVRRTGEMNVSTVEHGGRTWLVSRFVMPDNHGSVGVLGIDMSDQARAEEQLRIALRTADRWTRERALIAETLASLDAGRTPEETASAVCARVVELADMAMATIATFDLDGIATVIGQVTAEDSLPRVAEHGLRVTRERSAYLAERAAAGPWVERWTPIAGHPIAPLLESLHVRAQAFAPLTHGGEVRGLLIVGSSVHDAVTRLTERLPAIAEFAQITGALLGPQLSDRVAAARAAAAVRELIATAGFDIAFQPIVELATGQIPGYEALARFRDGADPDFHFGRAREAGLALELELACLGKALEQAARLEPGAWLNVNVSPEVVLSDSLIDLLPLQDRVVVLEITEHEAITDYAAFRTAIARLDGGVKVCVDDAGAGYASLRHIVELDPLFVKLDRSLVAGIGSDAARRAVVAGMVRFAETAGLTLIAEGIETDEELDALRQASVALGQGYLLGRPSIRASRRLRVA